MKPLLNRQRGSLHPFVHAAQIGIVSAGLLLLAGCSTEPDSHVVSAPPPGAPGAAQPVTVVTQSGTAAPTVVPAGASTVVVTQTPPALQTENPGTQPSSAHVWVPGYWTWQNSQYQWVTGRWAIPPEGNTAWIPPHWEPEGNGYRFYEGYWK
jgi:hypothetical protein